METLSKITIKQPLFFSFHNNTASHFPKSNSISFPKPRISINSSLSKPPKSISPNPNPKTLNPFSFLKTPLTIAVATAAVFISGLSHKPHPAFAETRTPTLENQTSTAEISDNDIEKKLEEYVTENPYDVQGLKSLMEVYIKNKKPDKGVEVLNKLVEIEPDEKEWLLLRAHMYGYMGETEMSKSGFEEILAKDPLRVEAYHGLAMAVSQGEEGGPELDVVVGRINDAIEKCKKEKRWDDVRDFRLLVAQIRVIEGSYDDALKVYEDLVKEEPRDFRPYLCRGIIYTLLKKTDEAAKQFDIYKKLVPQGHPYAQFFDDNMLATKVFSQMAENERVKVGEKS